MRSIGFISERGQVRDRAIARFVRGLWLWHSASSSSIGRCQEQSGNSRFCSFPRRKKHFFSVLTCGKRKRRKKPNSTKTEPKSPEFPAVPRKLIRARAIENRRCLRSKRKKRSKRRPIAARAAQNPGFCAKALNGPKFCSALTRESRWPAARN